MILLKRFFIMGIKIYRVFISPLKGPSCRFFPTCSQYAIDSLNRYGVLKGSIQIFKRIFKCHPFHPGGYDPVN